MSLTEETKEAIRQAARNLTGSGVPEDALVRMLADHAIGLLENQRAEWFAEPERTPEVVLRAMLAAWEHTAQGRAITWAPTYVLNDWGSSKVAEAAACVSQIRLALAFAVVGRDPLDVLSAALGTDYEKRLDGSRPLNAPPLEM